MLYGLLKKCDSLDALTWLRDARCAEAEAEQRRAEVEDENVYMSGV